MAQTPFDPKPVDTTQNKIDQAKVQAALAWTAQIDTAANTHKSADTAFLTVISRLKLPIDTNTQGVVAADLHHQDDILRTSADYTADVTAWGSEIVTNRSIAANPANADNQDVQDRLIFPPPPQVLITYSKENGISKPR